MVGGTITDVRNQKSWLWRHCRRRAIYWLLRSPPQTCHAKPKTQSTGAGRYSQLLFPVAGRAYRKQLLPKDFPKSQDAVALQWLRSVALYLWLIVVISVRQSTVAAISGLLPAGALVRYCPDMALTAWFKNSKKRAELSQRDWCMSRVTAIISALVICIITSLSWAVNHYRDNAITYKAQRRQKCQRTEAGERGNYWHADASAWCCCARCKYTKELADAKAENDALRDDVAAGRRRLHIKAVCQLVREATTASGVDNAAPSPDWQTPLNGIISPSEREADHYAKTTGRNPEVYYWLMSSR